jgi:putative oxidoreductase
VIQRLFSSFPDSWSGAGLLLLRLASGMPLVVNGILALPPGGEGGGAVYRIAELSCGSLVLIGLWTPLAGIGQAILWVAAAVGMHDVLPIASPVMGLSLALLGPGAWSVDARLYGRRRIRV